jgi:glycosyltransferase involved in cell wall biosynthesis
MKILHVIAGVAPNMGGPALNVVSAARALRVLGVESTIYSTDLTQPVLHATRERLRRTALPSDIEIQLFHAHAPRRLAFSVALDRAVSATVRDYDVVHIHALYLIPQLSAYRHASAARVPYIVSPCGGLDPVLRVRNRHAKELVDVLWQRKMLNRAALIHYKTREEWRLSQGLEITAPGHVVPNGISPASYGELPPARIFRERIGCGEGPVVLTIGRIAAKKALDVLIESFVRVRCAYPDAVLVLAGPDDEGLRPALESLAAARGLAGSVLFPGMLDLEGKREALAAADVWVLPSRSENFGSAVVEALAAGCATIVSPAVNLAPELEAACAAVIAEPEPAALAAAIVGLLDNASLRAELAVRGREFARRYEWPVVAQQMAAMYRAATEASDSATARLRLEVVR